MIAAALRTQGVLVFTDNNEAYGTLVGTLLPMGVKGVVIVGFIAALMTSLAAHFNSSATLFTIDFYKQYHPSASEHRLVVIGRIATITVVLLGLVWIPIMKSIGSVLYEYLQKVQSLIAPAIAAVFVLGVFNKRITPKAGQWGLLIGALIGFLRLGMMIFDPGSHYDNVTAKLVFDSVTSFRYMDCIEYQLAPILYRSVFIHYVINGCYQLLYSESRRKAITGINLFFTKS